MAAKKLSLQSFIKGARLHGLPTKFLQRVDGKYELKSSGPGGEDLFRPFLGQLVLSAETAERTSSLSFEPPMNEAGGIQAIYHEATHAFLAMMKQQPDVAALIREGERHYKKAPLTDKSKGGDTERLFQEAISEYVAHRAVAFWQAGEQLFLAEKAHKAGKASGRAFWDNFRRIPRNYEQAMGQRVFGYQNKGWPWARSQVETTKAISGKMKDFADRVILEGAIPDQFARVKRYADSYKGICRSVPGFICEF